LPAVFDERNGEFSRDCGINADPVVAKFLGGVIRLAKAPARQIHF
jgi:hypothetical protein